MPDIHVVTEEEFKTARAMESLLLASKDKTGIIFVGVNVRKLQADLAEYHVNVGFDRRLEMTEETVGSATAMVLQKNFAGLNSMVLIQVFRGSTETVLTQA